ncbi:MAG: HlyC/CorC family transporter [Chloroflexi bacterium]|nr:MAG: HlyC/CorC family transporter [Chloroflexota bacterium]
MQLITAVFAVLLASALCSGSEAALFSVPLVKARQLAESGSRASLALLSIRQNMSRPIASIVILNNIANIVGSIVVGAMATQTLGSRWLGLFSGVLTFLVIIFSEIIPKTLGERYAERISLWVALPVLGLAKLFTPLVWAIERLTSPVTQGTIGPTTTEAEIKLLARIGHQEGIIEPGESEMIHHVFKLNDVTAGEIMSPRVVMTYLPGNLTLQDAQQQIIESQHSRIVVIGENVDDVQGVVLKNELLTAIIEHKADCTLAEMAHEVPAVPISAKGNALLQIFRRSRRHLAVVIDEFGGVAGVVTLEDVLETLTGEIVDETDEAADLQEVARRQRRNVLPSPSDEFRLDKK